MTANTLDHVVTLITREIQYCMLASYHQIALSRSVVSKEVNNGIACMVYSV